MTRTRQLTLLLICATVLFCCKKKSSTTTTPPAGSSTTGSTTSPAPMTSTMTMNLNGAAWVSTKNSAALVIDTAQGISALVINGETSANIVAIGIDLPTASANLSVGSHDEGLSNDDALFTYSTKTSGGGTLTQHFTDEGTVNITSVNNSNKTVSGNFNVKMHKVGSTAAADSIKMTNGIFINIPFVVGYN